MMKNVGTVRSDSHKMRKTASLMTSAVSTCWNSNSTSQHQLSTEFQSTEALIGGCWESLCRCFCNDRKKKLNSEIKNKKNNNNNSAVKSPSLTVDEKEQISNSQPPNKNKNIQNNNNNNLNTPKSNGVSADEIVNQIPNPETAKNQSSNSTPNPQTAKNQGSNSTPNPETTSQSSSTPSGNEVKKSSTSQTTGFSLSDPNQTAAQDETTTMESNEINNSQSSSNENNEGLEQNAVGNEMNQKFISDGNDIVFTPSGQNSIDFFDYMKQFTGKDCATSIASKLSKEEKEKIFQLSQNVLPEFTAEEIGQIFENQRNIGSDKFEEAKTVCCILGAARLAQKDLEKVKAILLDHKNKFETDGGRDIVDKAMKCQRKRSNFLKTYNLNWEAPSPHVNRFDLLERSSVFDKGKNLGLERYRGCLSPDQIETISIFCSDIQNDLAWIRNELRLKMRVWICDLGVEFSKI